MTARLSTSQLLVPLVPSADGHATSKKYVDDAIATVITGGGGIAPNILDSRGDLITASADNTPTILPAGADGRALVADSTQTAGLRYSSTLTESAIASAVTLTGAQTLTNKTLTSPTINSPTINTPTINVLANALTIKDSTDPSKVAAFDVSSVSASTTRTLVVPNNNGTIALTSDLAGYVPVSRTVNGAALSSNVTLTQDSVGDGTTYKQYSGTEKTKLSGIATAATANSSDATLLARANHTGTQIASTISDFSTAADARISAAVGVSIQAYDADLAAIAGLTATTDNFLVSVSSAWASRTPAQVKTTLSLNNVDNTSNATERAAVAVLTNKDLSSGTNTFPTLNQSTSGNAATATKLATARNINGVAFDGTGNITINAVDSTAREPAITIGTSAQYWRGDKTMQTLNQDAVPDGTTNKAFTATMSTKLAGIASAATANSSDATLLARANHTGTQLAATISDFSTAADARVALSERTWAPEMVTTSAAVADGYNDMPGGISVEPGPNANGVYLDAVWLRVGDLATSNSGGDLICDIYGGTKSTQGTLIVSITLTNGTQDVVSTLGSTYSLSANAVVRAYFTKGSSTVAKPLHVQLRGRYKG